MTADAPPTTLTDFLLARIAEDEAVALAAQGEPTEYSTLGFLQGSALSPGDRIVAHPARVLAECEAKRRIVELHAEGVDYDPNGFRFSTGCEECVGLELRTFAGQTARLEQPYGKRWPCPTIRALAAIYSDHDDFRPEWAV